jgi:hypothetical protein
VELLRVALKEYEKTVQEASATKSSSNVYIPTVHVNLDEPDTEAGAVGVTSTGTGGETRANGVNTNDSAESKVSENGQASENGAGEEDDDGMEVQDVASYISDDRVKAAEIAKGDLERFFEEAEEEISPIIPKSVRDVFPSINSEAIKEGLAKHGDLKRPFAEVGKTLYELTSGEPEPVVQLGREKRKKRGVSNPLTMSTYNQELTPRDIRLLVSPLSHLPDGFLGTGFVTSADFPSSAASSSAAGTLPAHNDEFLPQAVIGKEDEAIRRLAVESASVMIDFRNRKTQAASVEWSKLVTQADSALQNMEQNYLTVLEEASTQKRMHRKDLMAHGIVVPPRSSDPPLSPLPSMNPNPIQILSEALGGSKKDKSSSSAASKQQDESSDNAPSVRTTRTSVQEESAPRPVAKARNGARRK